MNTLYAATEDRQYHADTLTVTAARLARTTPDEDLTGIFTMSAADTDLMRRVATR